MSWRW